MNKIKLDMSKLLGFRLSSDSSKLSIKAGVKPGSVPATDKTSA